MKPTVTIMAQGMMGAGIASRLTSAGVEVRTSLLGRGAASVERAREAAMRPVEGRELVEVDIILSIVPPDQALELAERIAGLSVEHGVSPLYVDCNPVHPGTVDAIASVVSSSDAVFVDGSIIGMPPKAGYDGPKIFLSGEAAIHVGVLSEFGLKCHVLDAPIGAASALKMSYGGITKGLIAIAAAQILGGVDADIAGPLRDELQASQPALFASFQKSVPDMFGKAGRWVSEMEEIAQFLGNVAEAGEIYDAMARFYRHLASNAGKQDIDRLAAFFEGPTGPTTFN